MSYREVADKYIGRRGGKPRQKSASSTAKLSGARTVKLTEAEYARLLAAAECDDMIAWCEGCGAWMDKDEEAYCPTEDLTGCWRYVSDRGPCVKHRAPPDSTAEGKGEELSRREREKRKGEK